MINERLLRNFTIEALLFVFLILSPLGTAAASENSLLKKTAEMPGEVQALLYNLKQVSQHPSGGQFRQTEPSLLSALTRPGECSRGQMNCKEENERLSALTRPGECEVGKVFCEKIESKPVEHLAVIESYDAQVLNRTAQFAH